ncbi:lim domain and actin-binding protein 1 [Limosa lapponica baueri]|uniref:Lim domain and actin-binding protein 1 n=1 Tax=Limosa lapponica baueri TaxID=1758121 RepID=A0A2I0TG62_LIMLA|nr:lim domain and actin-binding protein 1 [Limosa lapponica baueri]
MESCLREPRELEKPEAGENTEPAGKIEKYSVPLNKLKMMFEQGQAAQPKAERDMLKRSEELEREVVVDKKQKEKKVENRNIQSAEEKNIEEERELSGNQRVEHNFIENGQVNAETDEEEHAMEEQESPNEEFLEPNSPKHSSLANVVTAKESSPTQNRKSQDVGFWEGEDMEDLSVEEQIKRNRYYEDDDEE